MREAIKNEIKSLLSNKDNPVCVLLKGEWGVGKTHLWKEIETELKEKNNEKTLIAYVSLFGKENIAQIEQEIKTQISIMQELKEKFKNMGIETLLDKTTLIGGSSISGILSIFGNEIKNIIICFDDFERHSKNIEFRDILGEISVLKENNKCNILMIMNESELEKNNQNETNNQTKKDKEIFNEYKEKIVDFEFTYEPKPKDSLEIIKKDFGKFANFALEYFEANSQHLNITINNIRIMKKIANSVNHLSNCIENFNNLEKNIQDDFFATIADCILVQTNKKDKDEFFSQYFSPNFEKYIQDNYLNNNIPNNELLEKEVKNAIENYQSIQADKQLKEFQNNFDKFYRKFTMLYDYDFKKSNEEYAKEILEFLNNDNFTKAVTNYSVARFLIDKLDKLNDDKESNHNLGLKLMKEYIKIYKFDKKSLDDIIDFDKDKLQPFHEDLIKNSNKVSDELNLNSPEKIIEYLSFKNYDNWVNLKFIENEKLKEYFLNDAVCAGKCIKLSQNHEYKNLNEFRSKVEEILEDIANDKTIDKFIQDKANKVLNETKGHNQC